MTDQDSQRWVSEALRGVMPTKMDKREWIQEGHQDHEGKIATRYRRAGSNIIALVSVTPIVAKRSGNEDRRVSYQVTIGKVQGDRLNRPNDAEIEHARRTFFLRDLRDTERKHEGTIGDSHAYHFVALLEWRGGANKLVNPSGGLY